MYIVSYANHCGDTGCDVENKLFDNLRDARIFMLGSVTFDVGINDPETTYKIVPNEDCTDEYQSNIMCGKKIVGQIGMSNAWMYDDSLGWTYSAYWKIQNIIGNKIEDLK